MPAFDVGPLIVVFKNYPPTSAKNLVKIGPTLTKLSGSAHVFQLNYSTPLDPGQTAPKELSGFGPFCLRKRSLAGKFKSNISYYFLGPLVQLGS